MWAILDENNRVVDAFMSDRYEEIIAKETRTVIEMTPENSPAWIGAIYSNGKFIGEEIKNA